MSQFTILRLDASARTSRSLSRGLADEFVRGWRRRRPDDGILLRDVGIAPPPPISEPWIDAAFTPEVQRTEQQRALLSLSDELIEELRLADLLLIATPMYNYGMPAALKAWVDQVIRVHETFTFDLARGDWPLEPVLKGKTLVLLTSSGEFGFAPGGVRAELDHLTPTSARALATSASPRRTESPSSTRNSGTSGIVDPWRRRRPRSVDWSITSHDAPYTTPHRLYKPRATRSASSRSSDASGRTGRSRANATSTDGCRSTPTQPQAVAQFCVIDLASSVKGLRCAPAHPAPRGGERQK